MVSTLAMGAHMKHVLTLLIVLFSVPFFALVSAAETSEAVQSGSDVAGSAKTEFAKTESAKLFGLVVVGLGGDNDYREMFEAAAASTLDAVNPPVPEGLTIADTGGLQLLLENESSREVILQRLAQQIELANRQADAVGDSGKSRFMLIFFGHGSFDGEHYRFNTRGPDLTDTEIAMALQPLKTKRQFLMFATSASGAVLNTFAESDENNAERVIVTATKSGTEANAVQFPQYWADVLTGKLADTDHNELLTVLEAFEAANDGVVRHYDNRNLLATEHSRMVSGKSGDSSAMVFARLGSLRGQENNAEVNSLLQQRAELELEFNRVRTKRDALTQSDYLNELEVVLLEIARLQLRMDEATGWQPHLNTAPTVETSTEEMETDQSSGGQNGG